MTGADIIQDVRNQLMEPVAGFWTDSELLTWINRGEMELANQVRGFEDSATLPLVVGQGEYLLPKNWLASQAIFHKNTTSSKVTWNELEVTDIERAAMQNPAFLSEDAEDRGAPQKVWFWGRTIRVFPVPDATNATELKMFYVAKPIALAATTSPLNVDESLAPGIVAYVLWKAWEKEKEMELAQQQQAVFLRYVGEGRRAKKLAAMNKANQIDLRSPRGYTNSSTRPAWW